MNMLETLSNNLHLLTESEQRELFKQLDALEKLKSIEKCRESFLSFVKRVWPVFIAGRHHAKMANAFERVAKGELKRLIVNMPPRHTKSEFASWLLPAWFLGQFPGKKVIQTSHTAELAVGFGRKVRNLVDSAEYAEIFPNVSLQSDSKAAGRWNTNKQGEYFAIGVGGAVTGKGADLLIIDDPHSEQEATIAETSPEVYDKVYEWYTSGPRQRLQPGGAIIVVMCMTGDTPVLMVDGEEKPLSEVRPGDMVATFEKGRLAATRVNNWRSSGVDSIYKVRTQSGRILRANARHPFLVMNEGVLEWTRLHQLRVGDELVSLKDAYAPHEQKQNPACVGRAWQTPATTVNTPTPRENLSGTTVGGKESTARRRGASAPLQAVGYALGITLRNIYRKKTLPPPESTASSFGTASPWSSLMRWLRSAATAVMSADNPPRNVTPAPTGTESCASTTTMPPEGFAGCCATTAISQLDMERRRKYLNELQRISDFTTDPIVAITPDGAEEVFDVEIDRTENFIANGIVSHNTRWSLRDLTGQVLKASMQRGGDEWEVIEFPAILPSGKPLWPEFWSLTEMEALRKELPLYKWNAQYQQAPTSKEGAIVKREWWRTWEHDHPPSCDFIIQSWDTAFEKTNRSDFSACTTWGVWWPEATPDDPASGAANIILLDAFKERMEFPELKRTALKHYHAWDTDSTPVSLIVEKKASGAPLIYELRAMGIPVGEFTPSKGNDKISRLNSVSDMFASGVVWAPQTRWAEEVIDEVASFPSGEHDDLVDATTLALMRFRRGGFMQLATDEKEEPKEFRSSRRVGYY